MHIDDQILETLSASRALFVGEVMARTGLPEAEVDIAIARMAGDSILVVDHGSPDRHLRGDFRIVAAVSADGRLPAMQAVENRWRRFVQGILRSHRCV